MRFAPSSVRARLTLWYTLVLSLPLAAFAVSSYVVFSRALHERTDAFISDALTVFSREAVAERRAIASSLDAIRVTLYEVRFRDLDILVLDDRGALLAMSAPHESAVAPAKHVDSAAVLAALSRAGRPPHTVTIGSPEDYRVVTRPLDVSGRHFVVAGVYPLGHVRATLARIREIFLIVIPLLIACASTGGWFLAKRSFAPLEQAFEQQRRFMADASHELRTPSATLRAEADVTLSRPSRSEKEYRESMTVVQDTARRLTRIVDDIFLLARADAGHLVMQQGAVDLDDVVLESVRSVQPIAAERQVQVDLRDVVEAQVRGDADLLGRVMLNLLDNAVKYAPPDSVVDVRMSRSADRAVQISVVDRGPGIPGDARERVFERFFRVDTARSRAESTTTSGAGLGLPIARRIAELHGGHVTLVSSRPGHTEFLFRIPSENGESE